MDGDDPRGGQARAWRDSREYVDVPEHNADLVILGGGSGGYACALRAAELGMSVVLVETDKLGGTCLHSGCIPTKALLHAAEVADAAREGDQIGVKSSLAGIDMAGVNAYKDGVVAKLYKGLQGLVKSRKINFVAGDGHVRGAERRRGRTATGTSARRSCWPPAATPGRCPASRSAAGSSPATRPSGSTRCPQRIVVLGGGVIGVEFASVFKSFGSEVTIVEALPRLVPERGRVRLQAAGARVPPAQDRLQDRREVHRRQADRGRGHGVARVRRGHRGGPAARRGRPRPEHRRRTATRRPG